MITTVTTISNPQVVLGVVAVVTLIALLIAKELAGGARDVNAAHFARATNIAIVPLAFVVLLIIAARLG